MKVDGLGVIMAIILLPIILVVTYYIQLQVDTIARENSYNTKLLDATYDALSAFELNTANEELSSVADSMRSIILASNNTLFNTLATNLGMSNASQENLRPYVPAILYTMYDGYYIYSPAETAVVGEKLEESNEHPELTTSIDYLKVGDDGVNYISEDEYQYGVATVNGNGIRTQKLNTSFKDTTNYSDYGMILYKKRKTNEDNTWEVINNSDGTKIGCYTTDKNNAVTETDYILKPYTQYSARYIKGNNIDVTINYTLDNYINIEGTIGDVYYTKSGYLIAEDLVTNFNIGNGDISDFSTQNENDVKNQILGVKSDQQGLTKAAANNPKVLIKGQTEPIEANWDAISNKLSGVSTISEAEEMLKQGKISDNDVIYEIQKYNAIAYYASSAVFSNWVYDNLRELTYGDSKELDTIVDNVKLNSGLGKEEIYYNFHNDSVKTTKIFDGDPEDVKSNFNTHRIEVIKNSIKYNLNQSISAYCAMKGSNDYSMPVLTDTEWDNILSKISIVSFMQGWDCGLDVYNNYEIAYSTNNELTVIPSEIYYVPVNSFNNEGSDYHRIDCPSLKENNEDLIVFKSNEIKYDKLADSNGRYKYDHKNLACYTCINNNNYESKFGDSNNTSYYARINSLSNEANKLAGYIGLGAMRQGTYKTNALEVSEGYLIEAGKAHLQFSENIATSEISKNIANDVKRIEITFSGANYIRDENNINKMDIEIFINGASYKIPLLVTKTIIINNTGNNLKVKIDKNDGFGDRFVDINSIKYIYK